MGDGFLMLFVDALIYLILGWYFDKVLPKEYGVRHKWYFLFTPGYWKGSSKV